MSQICVLTMAFFFVIASQYLYRSGTAPLIVKAFGAKGIPAIELASIVLAALVAFIIARSRRLKWRLSLVLSGVCGVCILQMMFFPVVFGLLREAKILLVIASLSGSVVSWCGNYAVWMLLTATTHKPTTLQMTVFGTGAQVGVVLSGSLARCVEGETSVANLAPVAGLGYVVAFVLIGLAIRKFRCFGASALEVASPPLGKFPLSSLWRFGKLSYFEFLALAIICQVAFGDLLQWSIYCQMEHTPTVAAAGALLARFYQYSGVVCLGAQVLIVPLAYRVITPRYGLLIQPLLGILSVVSLAILASATGILWSVASYRSLEYTLNNCMREALYSPLPTSMKIHQKPVLAILAPRLGKCLAAVVILVLGGSTIGLAAFGVPHG